MRAMNKPQFVAQSVYEDCANSISDEEVRNRLNSIADLIVDAANDYDIKAQSASLFLISANNCENEKTVARTVTKRELKDLYTLHMVKETKPARRIYDELLAAAPSGKCPSCGFGHASTLDHFLPKSKFPLLSVLPLNLIPACKDCNTGKKAKLAVAAEQQVIHPYYDHKGFVSEQWLFAEVEQTSPASIKFHVVPPEHWPEITKKRVKIHFSQFNLSTRFSIEAADELSSLNPILAIHVSSTSNTAVKEYLEAQAKVALGLHKNSWKTAMYQALYLNDWYCEVGFSL